MEIGLKEIAVAVLTGAVPTFLWLWFWLSEDRKHPEPRLMLAVSFIVGVLAVIVTLPIQDIISSLFVSYESLGFFLSMATVEELVKFGLIYVLIALTPFVDEPIDYAIYLITGALGFAALENTLYLLDPLRSVFSDVGLSISSLRFLGSTLLHAVTAAIVGLSLGLAWHKPRIVRITAFHVGLVLVILLHAGFNFLIINGTSTHIFMSLVTLWIIAILSMYLFERVKRIN